MAKRHVMTSARKAALARAQKASAAKRRGKGKGKLAAANRATDSKRKRTGKISVKKAVGHLAVGLAFGAAGAYLSRKKPVKYSSHVPQNRSNTTKGLPTAARYWATHPRAAKLRMKRR